VTGGRQQAELRSLDPHAVEGGHVDDVEATAPIHEHLVHPLGSEEQFHHEGVSPQLWNVVAVVRSVVRDSRLGPPKV
jgi:hypothetical protein